MRILVIHQFYLRSDQPGGTRFNDFARVWRSHGHEVRVVASSVSYTSGLRLSASGFPWRRERDEAAEVVRTWTLEHPRGELVRRVGSMLGFGVGASVVAAHRGPRPDVVIATSPTLAAFFPGLVAAARWKCPLVLEVRDLWPDTLVSLGTFSPGSPITRASYGFEEAAYELADAVVALTPGIRDRLVGRGVMPEERVVVIPNGVFLTPRVAGERDAARRAVGAGSDELVALYSGAHGYANDLEQLVDVADELRDEPFRLIAIGEGPQKGELIARTRARGLSNLQWLDAVPREALADLFSGADVGMVFLKKSPIFETVYPNKMFDYMAAELPVVLGVDGVAADIVTDSGAGVAVPPEDPRAFADALRALARDPERRREMGRAGRACVERDFDRRRHAERYLELVEQLVG